MGSWGIVRGWNENRFVAADDVPAALELELGEWSLFTLTELIFPLLDGVEDIIGVGVLARELVVDAMVGVAEEVVDWDSHKVRRFIICGDMPGRFLMAVRVCVCGERFNFVLCST